MFRKPKRKVKEGLRQRNDEEGDKEGVNSEESHEDEEKDTSGLIAEARKRLKPTSSATKSSGEEKCSAIPTFASQKEEGVSNSDLATREALHLPSKQEQEAAASKPAAGRGADGIFRVDLKQNKFLAGPVKASQNIRVTARFDYQPDICKDYKDTGFCGFGDTCIYLHDRGDTLSGWQLEQQWEEEQRQKKQKQEQELHDFMDAGKKQPADTTSTTTAEDGLPFACFICREYFKDPIVTTCQHYFCESCIMEHVRQQQQLGNKIEAACPICHQDMHNVFHQPTKLVAKKRRVLGVAQSKREDSWKLFMEALTSSPLPTKTEE